MGRTQAVVGKVLRVALVVGGVGVVGYLALLVLVFYALQEPYPYLNVTNETARPLLVERADTLGSPGATMLGLLVGPRRGTGRARPPLKAPLGSRQVVNWDGSTAIPSPDFTP